MLPKDLEVDSALHIHEPCSYIEKSDHAQKDRTEDVPVTPQQAFLSTTFIISALLATHSNRKIDESDEAWLKLLATPGGFAEPLCFVS